MSGKRGWLRPTTWFGIFLGLLFSLCQFSMALAAPTVIATIPIGVTPFAEELNTATNRYYITDANNNKVLVIDGNTNTLVSSIDTTPYGIRPQGIGINPTTNRIYVTNFNSGNMMVLDGATDTVLTTITGFSGPSSDIVNPITNRIYVTEYSANQVAVVDGATNAIIATVPVGGAPNGIAINTASNRVFIQNSGSGTTSTIDGATNTVINTRPAVGIAADEVNNRVYTISGATITVEDGTTGAILNSVTLPVASIWSVEPSPFNNRLYVADYTRVFVLDLNTLATLGTVSVGSGPVGMAENPSTGRIFVLNRDSQTVSIIADIFPPTISKAFAASTIPVNGTTKLNFNITNPNQLDALSGVSFVDNMPAGLVVATPPNITNSCGGTLTANGGSATINLTGGNLAANGNCAIGLDITALTAGVKNNITQPISSTQNGPGLPSNKATLTVTAIGADVALTKTVDNSKPNLNTNVTFTLTAINNGPGSVSTLVISDVLPAGLSFVSNTPPSAGSVTVSGNAISWQIGTLANTASATLQIVVQVNQTGAIINTITKTQTELDPVSNNDQASIGLNAPTADLQIQKSANNLNPKVNSNVTFNVSVTNLGPDNATSVRVRDLLPGGLDYISSVAPVGTTYQPATGDWNVGSLSNGQMLSLQITAKVTQDGSITNTASKNGEDQYDFNLANDSASVTLSVAAKSESDKGRVYPADFAAQLRVTPDRLATFDPTNLISYTFTLKNIGQGKASQVNIRFPFDPNLTIGYTSFIHPGVWVSAIVTNTDQPYLQINLPAFSVNQIVTGTLVFRPLTSAQSDISLFTRYRVNWDDDERGGKQTGSNAVRFNLSADGTNRNETGGEVQFFDPSSSNVVNNSPFKFNADFYAPNEYVTLWYTNKDGVSVPLGTKQADGQGKLALEFVPLNLLVGDNYVIAGVGNRSEVIGSVVITVSG